MKVFVAGLVIGIIAILGAEAFAYWWMRPGLTVPETSAALEDRLLDFRMPTGDHWQPNFEAYDMVVEPLECSSGWIGDVESGGRQLRFSFFRWDWPATRNPLEAFGHMPEVCMGSAGWKLERVCEPRELLVDGHPVHFDVTLFRAPNELSSMYIYKAVWMKGFDQATLRGGFSGPDGGGFRRLRLERALNRSGMPPTRVLMGGIPGVPTEELAWREFRSLIEPHIRWVTSSGTAVDGGGKELRQ